VSLRASLRRSERGERREGVDPYTGEEQVSKTSAGAGIGNSMDKQEAALRQQLSGSGVSVTRVGVRRLVSRGFGESDPIASSASSAGKARNRRVEIHIGPR
jgi:hypothetical protein